MCALSLPLLGKLDFPGVHTAQAVILKLTRGRDINDGVLEPRARAFAFPLRTSARYLENSNAYELRA